MSTIRRTCGFDTKLVASGSAVATFGVEGAAIAAIYVGAGSGLGGAAAIRIGYTPRREGSPVLAAPHGSDGTLIPLTITEGAFTMLPAEVLVAHTFEITFNAAAGSDETIHLLTKT